MFSAMEERDQKRKERRALIEAEKMRKEEEKLVRCFFLYNFLLIELYNNR